MMISCNEAAHICNKTQYKEASLWEKVKLRLHVVVCATCAKFAKKNRQLTSLCEKAKLHVLSQPEKEQMKKRLKKEY